MNIKFMTYNGMPNVEVLHEILNLHTNVFGKSDDLIGRMKEKPKLHIDIAYTNEIIVGYKIGYALNREQFYSWLGGVTIEYRNHGIATTLMELQYQHVLDSGYKIIQTHTKNKWRSMLLLNIKNGFDIIGTYTDKEGEPKIILERTMVR